MSKIILSGGGTLGPVVPLLALREMYLAKHPDTEFVWVGTKQGPEREVVEAAGVRFLTIGAGKWRRYFSLLNLFDVLKIKIAFFQSIALLRREKPDLLISCGGFVSVPLHWAGWWLGIPSWVHQQDVRVGLANKLMFPVAKKITTALEQTALELASKKVEWLGNPVRKLASVNQDTAKSNFGIPVGAPVIFALGGGTGSSSINRMVLEALPLLPRDWHIIHLTGKDRPAELAEQASQAFQNYHVFSFFNEEMKTAYAAADVVIARAGFSTLSELALLHKAAIIVPIADTHQEDNARIFAEQGGIIMFGKGEDTGNNLAATLKELMVNPIQRQALGDKLSKLLPFAQPERIEALVTSLHK